MAFHCHPLLPVLPLFSPLDLLSQCRGGGQGWQVQLLFRCQPFVSHYADVSMGAKCPGLLQAPSGHSAVSLGCPAGLQGALQKGTALP